MNHTKEISNTSRAHLVIVVLCFCANAALAQSTSFSESFGDRYPRVHQIQEQGAILVGEMNTAFLPDGGNTLKAVIKDIGYGSVQNVTGQTTKRVAINKNTHTKQW